MKMNNSKRLVVFGGKGFIGSNLARSALREGWSVTACSRTWDEPTSTIFGLDAVVADSTSQDDCRRVITEVAPTAIYVAISALLPRSAAEAEPDLAFTEVRSLMNILQVAHENGVTSVGYCSSGGAIYGAGREAHLESDRCKPLSLYGQMKLHCESLLATMCENWSIDGFSLRIGNPYGPGQSPHGAHGVIAKFTHQILTRTPITIFGSAASEKDYVYIDDVSNAALAAFDRRARGTYNISSSKATSIATLVEKIAERCCIEPIVRYRELGSTEVSSFLLETSKAKRDLGWVAATNLDHGIDQTVAWIAETQLGHQRAVKASGPSSLPVNEMER